MTSAGITAALVFAGLAGLAGSAFLGAQAPDPTAEATARKKAEALYNDVYGLEHAKVAKGTPAEKSAFGKKLSDAAALAAEDAALYLLLLERAAEFTAAEPAGWSPALDLLKNAIDKSPGRTALHDQRAAIMDKMLKAEKASGKAEAAERLVAALRELAQAHARQREYEPAGKALERARATAKAHLKAAAKELLAEIDSQDADMVRSKLADARLEAARKTLKDKPDDPVANTLLGLAALQELRTEAAAPLLAKSGEPAFRKLGAALADKEIKPLPLADAFKAAAEGAAARETQQFLYSHARAQYNAALEADPKGPDAVRIKLILANLPAAPTTGGGDTKIKAASPTRRQLFDKIALATKAGNLKETGALGWTLNDSARDLPEPAGLLTGLDVFTDRGNLRIVAVRPHFQTSKGDVAGALHGKPENPAHVRFRAKDGYAIGALNVRHGLWIDGFSVSFMKIEGDALNPKASYLGEWIGGRAGGERTLGGDGSPIVGIKVWAKLGDPLTALNLIFYSK